MIKKVSNLNFFKEKYNSFEFKNSIITTAMLGNGICIHCCINMTQTFQAEAVLCTIPNFSVFFAELCMHAKLLIIVQLFSNLRCWIVHYLSFLEKKTELIYLHFRPFYNCSKILVDFLAKSPKRCAHCSKTETYIQNISWTVNDIERI